MLPYTFVLSFFASAVLGALSDSSLKAHVGSLSLSSSFDPVKDAYWTGYPHHRRTPFAVSPDGKSAYLAYLDSSDTGVHIQQVDPSTFSAVGDVITVTGGKEAGGLVAHDDGFALLTNEAVSGVTQSIAVLYRYTSGKQTWKTYLGGPTVENSMGHQASPDLNGDLVYSERAKTYGAYFVVTAYDGSASGHFGDTIQYVSDSGALKKITGATSDGFGCSHNTGIALENADDAPFASICAEDQGNIWLNTETQYMSGVRVSNENTTNGASGEPMGGMSGSYSNLARFVNSDQYIFAWVSKGAKDLTTNTWLGSPYTHSVNRTANRNVAIARFSDKKTLIGDEATNQLSSDGDSQINWITTGTADHSNTHVAAFDDSNALVTWEEIAQPNCPLVAFGCEGTFTGSYFQLVTDGKKVGNAIKSTNVYVSGDLVTMTDGRICWPYVDMQWSLNAPSKPASVQKMSFACMSNGASESDVSNSSSIAIAPASSATVSTQARVLSSTAAVDEIAVPTATLTTQTAAPADSTFPSLVFVSSDGSAITSSSISGDDPSTKFPVSTASLSSFIISSSTPIPTISSSLDICDLLATTIVVQKEIVTMTVTPSAVQAVEPSFTVLPVTGTSTISNTVPLGKGPRSQRPPYPTGLLPSGGFPFPGGSFLRRPAGDFPFPGGFGRSTGGSLAPSGFLTHTRAASETAASSSTAPIVPVNRS